MTPNERAIAECYVALFSARDDDFVYWTGDTWVRRGEPLTAEVIAAAFSGGPSVSGYTVAPDGRTHVCCLDFDSDDGMDLARRVRAAMAARGATGHVEVSRRGAHLWVLLDRELPARTVRRALTAFLNEAGVEITPKVEFRPVSDEIKAGGYGAPIRLPTMPHPKTGRRYPMLAADDTPLSPRLDQMLLAIDDSPAWVFEAMADTLRPSIKDVVSGDRKPYLGPSVEGSASDILRRLWGVPNARPGHSVRCPAHDDNAPSLSILADDQRALCKAPHCILCHDGKGRGTYELTIMAPRQVKS